MKIENRLSREKSPYLLQHKDNPVFWQPWGEEAFQLAREENRPIFLSIGYSTCYWCHVMEEDSFEQQEVADYLNQYFISIKVDREERPDVDHAYMDAVVAVSGRGGWPMSVFLTHDLKPFWGGTFFYRVQFLQILARIKELWCTQRAELEMAAADITGHLSRSIPPQPQEITSEIPTKVLQRFESSYDRQYGGFGEAPKFPPAQQCSLLLRIHLHTKQNSALSMVKHTLDRMARGGIYDQLGGGFHRYSVDAQWKVPHFEKMLYDNALIATAYLEAFLLTKSDTYRDIAAETLNYVLARMRSAAGGFYSAQDAGRPGEEGSFYCWDYKELLSLLNQEEQELALELYEISPQGNFEGGRNILLMRSQAAWQQRGSDTAVSLREKLLHERERRPAPHLDDKVLTAWNGLMIHAFALGFQALRDPRYLDAAVDAANFIREKLWQGDLLLRRYRDGEAAGAGMCEDYAFLIQGLLTLYESNFDDQWLAWAKELQDLQDVLFWDAAEGGYHFSTAAEIPISKKELFDGAIPSANSVSLLNLRRLYLLLQSEDLRHRFEVLLGVLSAHMIEHPLAFSTALQVITANGMPPVQIVAAAGEEEERCENFIKELQQHFIPDKVLAITRKGDVKPPAPIAQGKQALEGRCTLYICRDGTCTAPSFDLEDAIASIIMRAR